MLLRQHNVCYDIMSTMTSAETSLSIRERLVAAALTVLERDGPAAIQARTLTREIGVSTMAVYTHFGGMPNLIEAMVREGLSRFAEHTRGVPTPTTLWRISSPADWRTASSRCEIRSYTACCSG